MMQLTATLCFSYLWQPFTCPVLRLFFFFQVIRELPFTSQVLAAQLIKHSLRMYLSSLYDRRIIDGTQ